MTKRKKKTSKVKAKVHIDCSECKTQHDCCQTGCWADLEEAKKIVKLGLKGEFFQLEVDKSYPSGYRIGTSYGYNACSFLDPDGLCSVHKIDYGLKPKSCKEFPYENEKLAPYIYDLCTLFRSKVKNKRKK